MPERPQHCRPLENNKNNFCWKISIRRYSFSEQAAIFSAGLSCGPHLFKLAFIWEKQLQSEILQEIHYLRVSNT